MDDPMNRVESSSSSSDEDDRLKEALDPSMFDGETVVKQNVNKSVDVNKFKENLLDVTPEFQSYVGKHLADMLDKSIEERKKKRVDVNVPRRSGGIKLFEVSSEILTDDNFCEHSNETTDPKARKKRKYPKKRCDDDQNLSEMEKIKSAAVSPEWILEKHCIKGWSKPKGEEIRAIKNVNGELEIVASPFVSK